MRKIWKEVLSIYQKQIILAAVAIVLSPIVISGFVLESVKLRCGFVICLMALYWMLEVLPLAVTALLPLLLFPALDIADGVDVSTQYFKDIIVLVLGGLIVAIAIEEWDVHKRLALGTLRLFGSNQKMIILGFMLIGWFLSMWLSNTATTAMLMPIAIAVAGEFGPEQKTEDCSDSHEMEGQKYAIGEEESEPQGNDLHNQSSSDELSSNPGATEVHLDENSPLLHSLKDAASTTVGPVHKGTITNDHREYENFKKALFLSIAYACNIGGTATLTGTGPNALLAGNVRELYGTDTGFNFATYMIYAFPESLICLLYAWVVLCALQLPLPFMKQRNKLEVSVERKRHSRIRSRINARYQKLGPVSPEEKIVLLAFVVLALLWIFKSPQIITGWADVLDMKYVTDGTIAMGVAFFLFICPTVSQTRKAMDQKTLMTWDLVQKKLAWNLLILLGGGFAIAFGVKESKLDVTLVNLLKKLDGLPREILLIVIVTFVGFLTEFTSNTSTATIIQPILCSLADAIHVNPLFLLLPSTIACSFAFCLPVATPPNAIAFSEGTLKVRDMVKNGIFLNCGCFLIASIWACTWGNLVFGMNHVPNWVNMANITDK